MQIDKMTIHLKDGFEIVNLDTPRYAAIGWPAGMSVIHRHSEPIQHDMSCFLTEGAGFVFKCIVCFGEIGFSQEEINKLETLMRMID